MLHSLFPIWRVCPSTTDSQLPLVFANGCQDSSISNWPTCQFQKNSGLTFRRTRQNLETSRSRESKRVASGDFKGLRIWSSFSRNIGQNRIWNWTGWKEDNVALGSDWPFSFFDCNFTFQFFSRGKSIKNDHFLSESFYSRFSGSFDWVLYSTTRYEDEVERTSRALLDSTRRFIVCHSILPLFFCLSRRDIYWRIRSSSHDLSRFLEDSDYQEPTQSYLSNTDTEQELNPSSSLCMSDGDWGRIRRIW